MLGSQRARTHPRRVLKVARELELPASLYEPVRLVRDDGKDVSLPEEMPRPVQLFVVWLAILQWRRESSAGAATAASAASST